MTDPTTSTFEATMTFEDDDGADVPVKVSITYPKHHGLRAVHAMNELNNSAEPILARMAHSGDKSVRDALADAGLAADVEED